MRICPAVIIIFSTGTMCNGISIVLSSWIRKNQKGDFMLELKKIDESRAECLHSQVRSLLEESAVQRPGQHHF